MCVRAYHHLCSVYPCCCGALGDRPPPSRGSVDWVELAIITVIVAFVLFIALAAGGVVLVPSLVSRWIY